MRILVTGAKGFIGKNLVTALKNIMDKKDKVHNIAKKDQKREAEREFKIRNFG